MERTLILDAVKAEIDRLGGQIDDIRQGKGGHKVVYWRTKGGAKVTQTVPGYSGDWRSLAHARSNIRRAARS